jgi:hypothetical protein
MHLVSSPPFKTWEHISNAQIVEKFIRKIISIKLVAPSTHFISTPQRQLNAFLDVTHLWQQNY